MNERQEITFGVPTASGAGLMISNSAMITFAQSPTSAGSVTHVAVFDAATGGNMYLYGQLDTALSVQANVSPVFRVGSVSWLWSGNLNTYYRNAIMQTLRGTNCSGFAPYVAFFNGDPNGSGSEFSGNNYARSAVTMSNPEQQASGTAMSANSSDVISPVSTGSWGSFTHIAIMDVSSAGNVFAAGPLGTSYVINNGYSVTIPAGALQVNVN